MEDVMALHRSKLETDRQALRQISQTRSPIVPSRESLDAMNAPAPRKRVALTSPPYTGLQLGGYENHQKQLKAQANVEYNNFLQNQKRRPVYNQSPMIEAEQEIQNSPRTKEVTPRNKEVTPRKHSREDSEPSNRSLEENDENLEDAYQKLLERKREMERKYRSKLGDYPHNPQANAADPRRKVRFEKDDELSRAVQRLDALSAYDKELDEWNSLKSSQNDRAIKSAREERPEPALSLSDRSKSMPHKDSLNKRRNVEQPRTNIAPTPFEKDNTGSENRKKKYADELRRQMEEQRKAKIREKEEYIGSPSTKEYIGSPATKNVSNPATRPALKNSPLSDNQVRQRLAVKFDNTRSPEPPAEERMRQRSSRRIPASPPADPPGKLPQYPPGGYFPAQGGYMYPPPYMYPNPYMMQGQQGMPPHMMQGQQGMPPHMMQGQQGMPPHMMQGQQGMPPRMMPPQMMNQNPEISNPQYDPYQYYGLERRKSAEHPRTSREKPPTPRKQKAKNIEVVEKPVTRIDDIGSGGEVKNYSGKSMDPLDYARDLKRQVADREKQKILAKQEQDKYDRKIEAEIEDYNPWGRGGGGAPIKDAQGQSVADRKVMKTNAQNPHTLQKEQQASVAVVVASPKPKDGQNFGRVNEITGTRQEDDPVRIAAKEDYKSYLQQQIDERTKEKERQKELERLEDEKEARRVEEERLTLKAEFERELLAKQEKDEAHRKMNEGLKKAAEDRRHEQEKRTLEAKRKQEDGEARRLAEEKRQASAAATAVQRAYSPVLPAYADRPDTRDSIVIPTFAKKQPDSVRSSIVIPTHRSNASHRSPVVPKLDLTSPTEVDSGGLRESDRRPPSIVGQKTADVMQAGDVTKDHVMGQLSALREQLNRLQQVKRTQGQPLKVTDSFDTPLERAAKRRQPPPPARDDPDNLSILNQDLKDRYGAYSGLDIDDQLKRLQMQDRDSLDAQCSTEFVACTPEPTSGRRSTENTRYKRPPSATSTVSFDVHKIAERNEERLRRLENMTSDRIFKEESPDMIIDAFLENNRPPSELSLDCETNFKGDY